MRSSAPVLMAAVLLATTLGASAADAVSVREAKQAIKFLKQKQPETKRLFKSAYAYVVFPSVARGAFGVGGAFGEGVVFRRGKAIGKSQLKQLTIGLGGGAENFIEIIFFEDQTALKRFKKGELDLGAHVNAVVANKGKETKSNFSRGVAVRTVTKQGLMLSAQIGGQILSFEPFKR